MSVSAVSAKKFRSCPLHSGGSEAKEKGKGKKGEKGKRGLRYVASNNHTGGTTHKKTYKENMRTRVYEE